MKAYGSVCAGIERTLTDAEAAAEVGIGKETEEQTRAGAGAGRETAGGVTAVIVTGTVGIVSRSVGNRQGIF